MEVHQSDRETVAAFNSRPPASSHLEIRIHRTQDGIGKPFRAWDLFCFRSPIAIGTAVEILLKMPRKSPENPPPSGDVLASRPSPTGDASGAQLGVGVNFDCYEILRSKTEALLELPNSPRQIETRLCDYPPLLHGTASRHITVARRYWLCPSGRVWKVQEIDMQGALVVDDEPIVCQMIEKILKSAGIGSIDAHTEQEAPEILDEGMFDVVFLDLHMPTPMASTWPAKCATSPNSNRPFEPP